MSSIILSNISKSFARHWERVLLWGEANLNSYASFKSLETWQKYYIQQKNNLIPFSFQQPFEYNGNNLCSGNKNKSETSSHCRA